MFRRLTVGVAVLSALAVAVPAGAQAPGAVQRGLDELVRGQGFPAAMASVREPGGRDRFYAAGAGDLATGAPVPTDGQFRIASSTKMFTATVVLALVGEGKVG